MKVLLLGSHCDDIELGCGATLDKHRDDWQVTCFVLSNQGRSGMHADLWKCSLAAFQSLGISNVRFGKYPVGDFRAQRQAIWEELNTINQQVKPDLVFTQEPDRHPDHVVLYRETMRVFRRATVVAYRSSAQSSPDFLHNTLEVISQKNVQAKLRALRWYKVYSAKRYFCPKNVIAQLRVNAIAIDQEFAEAFRLVQQVNLSPLITPAEKGGLGTEVEECAETVASKLDQTQLVPIVHANSRSPSGDR